MKKLIGVLMLLVGLAACNNQKKAEAEPVQEETISATVVTYSTDSLMAIADQLVDQKVIVEGHVMHVCKHSGKKCFLVGDGEELLFRVESAEGFAGFDQEIIGNKIAVNGLVKKASLLEQDHEHEGEEACETESANKNEQYYLEAESYEVID